MKIYETINNIRVEVIQDDGNFLVSCRSCCFDNDHESCNMSNCNNHRDVHFKLAGQDDEAMEREEPAYNDDFVKHLHGGMEYYQGVCKGVGNILGISAYTSDDGSIQDTVVVAKIEELVAELILENVKLKSENRSLKILGSQND